MVPLAETLSYSNSIVKINLGINYHKIPRYTGASDTKFDMTAKYFTGIEYSDEDSDDEYYSSEEGDNSSLTIITE